jgi:hypothetical protein
MPCCGGRPSRAEVVFLAVLVPMAFPRRYV